MDNYTLIGQAVKNPRSSVVWARTYVSLELSLPHTEGSLPCCHADADEWISARRAIIRLVTFDLNRCPAA
jgi:hypothetical protein